MEVEKRTKGDESEKARTAGAAKSEYTSEARMFKETRVAKPSTLGGTSMKGELVCQLFICPR